MATGRRRAAARRSGSLSPPTLHPTAAAAAITVRARHVIHGAAQLLDSAVLQRPEDEPEAGAARGVGVPARHDKGVNVGPGLAQVVELLVQVEGGPPPLPHPLRHREAGEAPERALDPACASHTSRTSS